MIEMVILEIDVGQYWDEILNKKINSRDSLH